MDNMLKMTSEIQTFMSSAENTIRKSRYFAQIKLTQPFIKRCKPMNSIFLNIRGKKNEEEEEEGSKRLAFIISSFIDC